VRESGDIELPVYSGLRHERLEVGPCCPTTKHLADRILTSRSALEGERKLVTAHFAVASCTSLSEKLNPEEVSHVEAIAMDSHSPKTRSQEDLP